MSKGSTPRPYSIPQSEFANNYDAIFRSTQATEPTPAADQPAKKPERKDAK